MFQKDIEKLRKDCTEVAVKPWDRARESAEKLSSSGCCTVEIGVVGDVWRVRVALETNAKFEQVVDFETEGELAAWLNGVCEGIRVHLILTS